jgi:hypothetical protein
MTSSASRTLTAVWRRKRKPFRLALYDRERRGEAGNKFKSPSYEVGGAITWIVLKANGQVHSTHGHPAVSVLRYEIFWRNHHPVRN